MNRIKLLQLPHVLQYYYGKSISFAAQHFIDLRSDTVTKPSQEMLQRMVAADVGDDVYKEDATVKKLEETCADLFGMEDALLVPSGTMGNLICVMSHFKGCRGAGVIVGANQHVYGREQGNFMQFASIPTLVLPNKPDGTICLKEISDNIFDDSDFHSCETKLICVENTHMRAGGIPLSVEYMQQVGQLARSRNIAFHVDGARLYNAAVSLDCKPSDLLVHADSVSMCLSKGLGCPVGSVIGGTKDFINQAMRIRKALGGGMRQSGFLAAAGIYALEHAFTVLSADHDRAKNLAKGIKDIDCPNIIDVNIESVQSNIIFTKTREGEADTLAKMLNQHDILCGAFDASTIRFVLHKHITDDDISYTLASLDCVIQEFVKRTFTAL